MPLDSDIAEPGSPHSHSTTQTLCAFEEEKVEPIAIIGFSARLPGDAASTEGFWQMLCEGRSARTEVPESRLNINAFYHPDPDRRDATNIRTGHFLTGDIGAFDAPFFSIQPAEAVSMDPQQRLMLEASYRALENAGIPMEAAVGSNTSVFVGASARDYESLILRDPENPAKYLGTGIGTSLLANRISWFFDFCGTSIALDTACSSSLSALHLGCQSLRNRETSMSLVGGCNLILAPDVSMVHLSNMGFFSPDGKCYSFDHRANGYAKGEGAGIVVIKRLADAIADGDTIRVVIRATGTNQDGKTPGITQPSKTAQERNIRDTYNTAGLDFDTTKYFEAHGTGTQVGDPIEAGAIYNAFQRHSDNPLYVGALKTNIGHLEAGSGIASLIKTVMVLENGLIPPNLWFERANESIPAEKWGLKFPTDLVPWPSPGLRRASVNSFGYGGANAHAVIDDAYHYLNSKGIFGRHHTTHSTRLSHNSDPSAETPLAIDTQSGPEQREFVSHDKKKPLSTIAGEGNTTVSLPKVFVWSSSDEDGIRRLTAQYAKHFPQDMPDQSDVTPFYLDEVAYTLSSKRSNLSWKSYAIADNIEGLQQALRAGISKPIRSSSAPNVALVFTGQGAQWAGMGCQLLEYSTFRQSLRRSEAFLKEFGCGWGLIEEMAKPTKISDIDNPAKTQPLCTALQIGLVDLLLDWGLVSSTVVGHSSGEIAAAYWVGRLSHRSAMKVAYFRGAFAAQLAHSSANIGAMISVSLSESDVDVYLTEAVRLVGHGLLSVGCVNSPKSVTVTGDEECVDALGGILESAGIFARRLPIRVAYHSSFMDTIASEYKHSIADIESADTPVPKLQTPIDLKMFSSVTGNAIDLGRLSSPDYWVTNLVSQVKFSEAVSQLCLHLLESRNVYQTTKDILLEIGPHAGLQRPVKDILEDISDAEDITYDSTLKRQESDLRMCLGLVGRLFCHGCELDLTRVNSPELKEADMRMLVDLPEYPFNHSQTFWYESRISRGFRWRKHPRHELLGTTVADWNPMEPKWRNFWRYSDNPWLQDHKLGGSVLFPAAGMMTAALEAIRQLCEAQQGISGYHLNDIRFVQALPLSSSADGVETQMHLHPLEDRSDKKQRVHQFILYAHLNDQWTTICKGSISIGEKHRSNWTGCGLGDSLQSLQVQHLVDGIAADCKADLNAAVYYRQMATYGFEFGPTFQSLYDIKYSNNGKATALLNVDAWRMKRESGSVQDHVIHPTALDGMLQLSMVAISQGAQRATPVMVPTQLKFIWVSHELSNRSADFHLRVFVQTTFKGFREADFTLFALDSHHQVQIAIEGWREVVLDSTLQPFSDQDNLQLCYSMAWKPDPALMEYSIASRYCENIPNSQNLPPAEDIDRLEFASLLFMSDVLEDPWQAETPKLPSHLNKYLDWMRHQFDPYTFHRLKEQLLGDKDITKDQSLRNDFLEEVASSSPEGALCVTIGRNLGGVLKGEKDALDLLFSGSLVQDFYHSPAFQCSYSKIARYVDLLAHKNADLKILEIGAGTGAATRPILQALTSSNDNGKDQEPGQKGSRLGCYHYTDISPSFFQDAKNRFAAGASNRLNFKVLDIEKDPLEQGFESGKYDLIVCGLVLHATADINNTLQNTRKLLKAGGTLVLFEPSNPDPARVSFVFGLLPGWWLSKEKEREWGPLLSDASWHQKLLDNGFSGAEICLPDYLDEQRHTFSAIITTAIEEPLTVTTESPRVFIIVQGDNPHQYEVARQLKSSLEIKGAALEIAELHSLDAQSFRGAIYISLLECNGIFLANMSEADFSALKTLSLSAEAVLWVSQGGIGKGLDPRLGLATGFGRALRSEKLTTKFVGLTLQEKSPLQTIVSCITSVYQTNLIDENTLWESEFLEKDGTLYINRVVEADSVNEAVGSRILQRPPELQALGSASDRPLELAIATPGKLDSFYFRDPSSVDSPLGKNEVEIKVEAVALDEQDAVVALGRRAGNTFGSACSGVVTRLGDTVESFQIGDHVCCYSPEGCFKTTAQVQSSSLIRLPKYMSFSDGAAFANTYLSAHYAVHEVGRPDQGASVLILSAVEPIGQAVILSAKQAEADVYAVVNTCKDRDFLCEVYGISQSNIFVSEEAVDVSAIIAAMNGGVDIIFDPSPAKRNQTFWHFLKPLGKYIDIMAPNNRVVSAISDAPDIGSISYTSVDLAILSKHARPMMTKLTNSAADFLATINSKNVFRQPKKIFGTSEVQQAFKFVTEARREQVIVELKDDAMVPIAPSTRHTYSFLPNGTYVIAGGFGGLGRYIIRWMADRGARNFLIISRSGAQTQSAQELVSEMRARGVRLEGPACDITNELSVRDTFSKFQREMPSIRGCIQASMVLKDGLFENSSLKDFNTAINPKVYGTWNLHKVLPEDLDFFILLSSVSGVTGSRGQTNYAAGNTYQDAFARRLVALGRKCISIDLGSILDVGIAAEKGISAALENLGYRGIPKAELLALLDYCCDPNLSIPSDPDHSQIITGLHGIQGLTRDQMNEIYWARKPLFSILRAVSSSFDQVSEGKAKSDQPDHATLLRSCSNASAAQSIVLSALMQKLANGLNIPVHDVDAGKTVYAHGVDSLVALELRYWFQREMGVEIGVIDIMQSPNLKDLARKSVEKSTFYLEGEEQRKTKANE